MIIGLRCMGIISTDLKGAIAISLQSFPNSGKGWGGWIPPSGGNREFYWVGGYLAKGTWGGVIFTIQTFFKAKNKFLGLLGYNLKIVI